VPNPFVRSSEQVQVSVAQGTDAFMGYPRYGSERVVEAMSP